jgi:alpha/beta superfamily hydrolase
MMQVLSVLALGLSSVALAAPVETAQLKTPRGAMVNVEVNVPAQLTAQAPAVVIAPGQGYNMDLPIIQGLAEALAADGILAFRFNYNYYSTDPVNGQPSADLSNELQDMQTVIAYAKADSRVNPSQVIFAGKSLGSVVSFQAFQKDSQALALILMTPLCTSSYDDNGNPLPKPVPEAAQAYPGLLAMTKPIVMALGNNDPNCSLPMLYDFLKDSTGNVAVDVIGGDHSWDVSQGTDPVSVQRNATNVAAGVQAVTHWIDLILSR